MEGNLYNTTTTASSTLNHTIMSSLPSTGVGEGRNSSSSVEHYSSSIPPAGSGGVGDQVSNGSNVRRLGNNFVDLPRERTPSTTASEMATTAAAESNETDTFPPAVHPARANAARSRSYAGYQSASRPPPLTGLQQSPFTTTHYLGTTRQQQVATTNDINGLNDMNNNDDLKSSRESLLLSPICTSAPMSFASPQRGESLPLDISTTTARLNAVDIDIDDDDYGNTRRAYNRGGYGGIPSYNHSFSTGNAGGANNMSVFPTPPRSARKGPSPLSLQPTYGGGGNQQQRQYETRGGSVPPATHLQSSVRASKHSGARSASFQTDAGGNYSDASGSYNGSGTLTRNNAQSHHQYGQGNNSNYYNNGEGGGDYSTRAYNEPSISSPSSASNASTNNQQQVGSNNNDTGYQQRILPTAVGGGGMPLSPTSANTSKTTRVIDRSLADYLSQLMKDKSKLEAITGVMAASPGGPMTPGGGMMNDNIQFLHLPRLLEDEIIQVRVQLFEPEDQQPPLALPEPAGNIVRCEKRVPIPVNEYPNFNFVGRILGPRGLTVQQLEKKTGCKIMIRGKGSQHDKKKQEDSHRMGRGMNDQNEPLHVLVSAEDHENRAKLKVKEGEAEIRKLLIVPTSEGGDELKKRQLLELAILNGTYRGGNQSGANPQQSGTGGRNASGVLPNAGNYHTRTESGYHLTYVGSGNVVDPQTPIDTAYDPNTGQYYQHQHVQQAYASTGGRAMAMNPLSFRANSGCRNFSGQQQTQQSLQHQFRQASGLSSYLPLSCAPGNGTQMLQPLPSVSAAYGVQQQQQHSSANTGVMVASTIPGTPCTQQSMSYGSMYPTAGTVTIVPVSSSNGYEQQKQPGTVFQLSGQQQQLAAAANANAYAAYYQHQQQQQQQQARANGLMLNPGQTQQTQMVIVPNGQQQQAVGTAPQQQFGAMFGAIGTGAAPAPSMQANQTAPGFLASLPPYVQAGLQMTPRNLSGTGGGGF